MAANTGISQLNWEETSPDEGVQNRHKLAILMDRLRTRGPLQRSWTDSIKAVRMAMADKRHQSDAVDRSQLQRWLDTLQKAMKVLSQLTLAEQLEAVARQVGLKFTPPSGPDSQLFVSSDMFYVQVAMDKAGMAKEVKIAHQGEPESCQDLQDVLSRGDFNEFTSHLEGLCQIYNISGDKKQKTKTFLALQSLESDLSMLAQLQSSISGDSNRIFRSPLGILLPRKGGRPMKLIYFVSPYDLLDRKTKLKHPLTVDSITEHQLGHSVTISIEHSSLNRLQTMPLMSIIKNQEGKSLPSFSGLTNMNSCMLPACFVLTLPTPLSVLTSQLKKIESITNIDVPKLCEGKKLLALLVETVSKQQLVDKKELFVTLPDQQHVYFLGGHHGWMEEEGVLISRIPFTHPTNLPKILICLRQQMLFNTVFSSCIRPNAKQDATKALVFEMSALSLYQINVSFEHPLQDSMVTAEFDMNDITNLKCRVCTAADGQSFCSDEYASKVFNNCMSIPVSLRAIMNKVLGQLKKTCPAISNSHTAYPMDHYSGHMSSLLSGPDHRFSSRSSLSQLGYPHRGGPENYKDSPPYLDPANAPPELLDSIRAEKVARNPLLATLLDQDTAAAAEIHNSPMLSKLLDDHTTATTCMVNTSKPKKSKKRKGISELTGRSPKQKHIEDTSDMAEETDKNLIEIDSRSPSLSSAVSTPPEHSSSGTVTIDLTDNYQMSRDSVKKPSSLSLNNVVIKSEPSPLGSKGMNISMLDDVKPGITIKKESESGSSSSNTALSMNDPLSKNGVPSLDDLLSDSGQPINPDDFTNKTQKLSEDFLENGTLSRSNSESQVTTFPGETLDFSNELLNTDSVYPGNDDMDIFLDNCDKIAFGPAINNWPSSCNSTSLDKSGPGNTRPIPILEKLGEDVKEERNIVKPCETNRHKTMHEGETKLLAVKEEAKSEGSSCGSNVVKIRLYTNELKKTENWKGRADSKQSPNDTFGTTIKISSPHQKHSVNSRSKDYEGKSEKSKKKESKHSSSNSEISGKRRKEKEESKKERKKRKQEKNDDYSRMAQGAVYRSTQVESSSDSKPMPKLKITKSFLKLDKKMSNISESSKRTSEKSSSSKYDFSSSSDKNTRYDQLEKFSSSYLSSNSKDVSSDRGQRSHRTARSLSSSSHTSQNITVNKEDSKLITKTPTVKLKPLVMPVTSGSSVNVSSVRTPSVYSNATHSANKTTTTTVATSTILSTSLTSSSSSPSTSPVTPSATTVSSLTTKITVTPLLSTSASSSNSTANSPSTTSHSSSSSSTSNASNLSAVAANSSSTTASSNKSGNNNSTSSSSGNGSSYSTSSSTTGSSNSSSSSSNKNSNNNTATTTTSNNNNNKHCSKDDNKNSNNTSSTTTNTVSSSTSSTSSSNGGSSSTTITTTATTTIASSSSSSSSSNSTTSSSSGGGSGNSSKLKAAIRSRKGSLSAVIDKLNKTSTTNVHVCSASDGVITGKSASKDTSTLGEDEDEEDEEDDDDDDDEDAPLSKPILSYKGSSSSNSLPSTSTEIGSGSGRTNGGGTISVGNGDSNKLANREPPLLLAEGRLEHVEKKEQRSSSKREGHLSSSKQETSESKSSNSSSSGSSSSSKHISSKFHRESRSSAMSSTSKALSRENGRYSQNVLELSSPGRSQSPFVTDNIKVSRKNEFEERQTTSPHELNPSVKLNDNDSRNVQAKISSDWECSRDSSRPSENLDGKNKGRYISETSSKSWNRLNSVEEESGWCSEKPLSGGGGNIATKQSSSDKTCSDSSNSSADRELLHMVLNNCRDLDSSTSVRSDSPGTKVHGSLRRMKSHSHSGENTKFNGESDFSKILYEPRVLSRQIEEETKIEDLSNSSGDFEKHTDFDDGQAGTVVKRKLRTSSVNPISPGSDASSPENGLIIDCMSSPKGSQQSQQQQPPPPQQPRKHSPAPVMVPSKADIFTSHDSKHKFPSRSPTPSPRPKTSPPLTPPGVRDINTHSNSNSASSCSIDNELMDEALIMTPH